MSPQSVAESCVQTGASQKITFFSPCSLIHLISWLQLMEVKNTFQLVHISYYKPLFKIICNII